MDIQELIKKDKLILKFSFYGFFKNLKFFEPYLLIYLYSLNIDLFYMGILWSIRATFTYLFEVPSAIVADIFGKRNTLLLSFVFYMISFVFYFWAYNFLVLALAMIFFGLGEAFRSGNHKAMILSYVEEKGWQAHKTLIYGHTRSYSLIGSSFSAFLSILFILNLPLMKWIFILSIVPYLIDFILVASYPKRLNEKQSLGQHQNIFNFGFDQIKSIIKDINIVKIVMSSSIYDAIFKTIKDYIQAIFALLLVSASMTTLLNFNTDDSLKIYLGLLYGLFYIFSSLASRNVFKLIKNQEAIHLYENLFFFLGVSFIILGISVQMNIALLTMFIYLLLYLMKDARRPLFVDVLDDYMKKEQRVTVLSIESQMTAMLMIVFAPIFGYIAEHIGISFLFYGLAVSVLLISFSLKLRRTK